jgi:biopolymer transport protein ExbD/biopolymer transport protein TolR
MGFTVGTGKPKGATPQMNITPLVDVVLVLLIIFMVVTPLLSKTFALNLPKKDDEPAPPGAPNEQIVLLVTRDGRTLINNHEIARTELEPKLRTYLAAKSDKVVYFDAEDGTPYATAVAAMDQARGGGARTVAILTEKLAP